MLPDPLKQKIRTVWGPAGEQWIGLFDSTLSDLCNRWQLSEIKPFPDLSYNFVAAAEQNGRQVVLKLGAAPEELAEEARALKAFGGPGVVKLLAHEDGALLLERLDPGIALWQEWTEENDDAHTTTAAHLMNQLWQASSTDFRTTAEWFAALTRYQTKDFKPLPKQLIDKAIHLSHDLHMHSSETMLLHGDLHHGNILSHKDGYKTIDPKGVVGDRAFEAGAWIRNPCDRIIKTKDLNDLIDRRLRIIADITSQDIRKLRAWSFCACVLSAVWSVEDEGGGWDEAIACAQALA